MNMEDLTIDDITLDDTQARVTISGVPDTPGIAAKVFEDVAAAGIFVDMIVQSHPSRDGAATLSFTVPQNQLDQERRRGQARSPSRSAASGVTQQPEDRQALGQRRRPADATRAWPSACSRPWPRRASTSR